MKITSTNPSRNYEVLGESDNLLITIQKRG